MGQTQVVMGCEFPSGPGPGRKFLNDLAKWRAVVEALEYARGCLGVSDRGFYRQLIGVEALARANLRDRHGVGEGLAEPALPWLSGHNGLGNL